MKILRVTKEDARKAKGYGDLRRCLLATAATRQFKTEAQVGPARIRVFREDGTVDVYEYDPSVDSEKVIPQYGRTHSRVKKDFKPFNVPITFKGLL